MNANLIIYRMFLGELYIYQDGERFMIKRVIWEEDAQKHRQEKVVIGQNL